jgi:hypothetical protein
MKPPMCFYDGAFTNLLTRDAFVSTFTNSGAYTAPFGTGDVISLQTLYFSINYPNGMEAGSNQLAYLEERLQAAESAGRPVWILLHIPPGIDPYATWTQWAGGNTNVVVTDWVEGFIAPFCSLVSTYSNTIAGLFGVTITTGAGNSSATRFIPTPWPSCRSPTGCCTTTATIPASPC